MDITNALLNSQNEKAAKYVVYITETDGGGLIIGKLVFEALVTTNSDGVGEPTEAEFSEYGHIATGVYKEYNNRPTIGYYLTGGVGARDVQLTATPKNANTFAASAKEFDLAL